MPDNTMNLVFDLCVYLLMVGAEVFNCTYEEINVVIFCIVGPIVFFALVGYNIYLSLKLRACERL